MTLDDFLNSTEQTGCSFPARRREKGRERVLCREHEDTVDVGRRATVGGSGRHPFTAQEEKQKSREKILFSHGPSNPRIPQGLPPRPASCCQIHSRGDARRSRPPPAGAEAGRPRSAGPGDRGSPGGHEQPGGQGLKMNEAKGRAER